MPTSALNYSLQTNIQHSVIGIQMTLLSSIPILARHVWLGRTELSTITLMNKEPLNSMSQDQCDNLWKNVTDMVIAKRKPIS
jgi:hypothetical protein